MDKLIGASILAISVAFGGAALAQSSGSGSGATSGSSGSTSSGMTKMSQSECENVWARVDSSKSGNVTQVQAQTYVSDFTQADTNKDGQLSRAEFTSACDKGLVRSAAAGTGSGSSMGGTSGGTSGSSGGAGSSGTSGMGSGSSGSGSSGSSGKAK